MEKYWIEQLRKRFSDRQAAAPDGLWEGIEAAMRERGALGGVPADGSKRGRTVPLRWRRAVAAAACVAVVAGAGWLYFGQEAEYVAVGGAGTHVTANADKPAADVAGDIGGDVVTSSPGTALRRVGERLVAAVSMTGEHVAEVIDKVDSLEHASATAVGTGTVVAEAGGQEKKPAEQGGGSVVVKRNPPRQSGGYRHGDVAMGVDRGHGGGHGSISMAVYGGGTAPFGNSAGGLNTSLLPYAMQQSPMNDKNVVMLLSSADDGYMPTAEGNEVRVKHRQPVKVGMSARFNVARRVSVEAGLNYSYHSSDIASGDDEGGYKTEQKLHFVGVPVSVSYDIWHTDYLEVYASAGGAAEFCVSGKSHTDYISGNEVVRSSDDDVRDTRTQWSVNALAGVQYNFSSLVGIYAEPGVSYYFDNGSNVSTIYKDKPLNFNLNVGLRFTIR